MGFQDLIKDRYSVRAYKPDAVENENLQKVLEAAVIAPTASNKQPFRIIVIHTAGREEELLRIYKKDWFVQPPLVLCICGVTEQGWVRKYDGENYTTVDAAIAFDHLILAAHDLGLGTCWVANFDPAVAREVLNLPAGVEPIAFTPLGYPADEPKPKKRKALEDLVRYDRW